MSLKLDTHLFGSRTGYQCLAKSAGVSSAEDRLLSEFGFGQSSDDRFLRGLVSSPTAFARPLPGGRIAITRVLAGPLDDGGRPTLERRSILLSAREYLSVRRQLGQLLSNPRIWSATEFSSGQPISVEAPRASGRSAQEGDWLVFDAWVSALDRPPHAVVVGSGDDPSDTILSAVACLADEDALRFSWGIRLLSPIAWVDVISLSPYGSMDGRRQVFGLSRSGCVNPAVSAARASHPDRLPSLAELRPAEVHAPEARGGRRGDRAGRRPDARPAGARARTRVLVAVSAISVIMVGVVVVIVLWRGQPSRGPGPMLGSGAVGSDGLGVTRPPDSSEPATDPAPSPAPQTDLPPDPPPALVPESAPPIPAATVSTPAPKPHPAPDPTPPPPPPPPPPSPPAPPEPSLAGLAGSEVDLSPEASESLLSLVAWATQLVERDLRILALYKPLNANGVSPGLLDLLREHRKGQNMRAKPPLRATDDPRKREADRADRQAYEIRLGLIRDRCNDIIQLGSSAVLPVPPGVQGKGFVGDRLRQLQTRMAELSVDSPCSLRSELAPLVLESAVLLAAARQFMWDQQFLNSESAERTPTPFVHGYLRDVEMFVFDIPDEREWNESLRCQRVLAGCVDSLQLFPAAEFQPATTVNFLKGGVAKVLPKDAWKGLGSANDRTVSGYLEQAMTHVIGDCATSGRLRNAWDKARDFVVSTEPAKP